jgi:hypothetical protein
LFSDIGKTDSDFLKKEIAKAMEIGLMGSGNKMGE